MSFNRFNILKLLVIFIYLVVFFTFSGCDGGSTNKSSHGNPQVPVVTGQALLGPLTNAAVDVYRYDDLQHPLHSTMTSHSNDIFEAGLFDIPEELLKGQMLYVVVISGGMDIDADDDGYIDVTPTENQGKLHLAATGSQLKSGEFKANVLTDIVYQKISYLLLAQYPMETIIEEMDIFARSLISEDLNGDGKRDIKDLLVWNPLEGKHQVIQAWELIENISSAIRTNQFYPEELSEIRRGFAGSVNPPEWEYRPAWDYCVDISGNYAFVLDGIGVGSVGGSYSIIRLQIIDVNNPLKPLLVGISDKIYASIASHDLEVVGNYVFAAIGGGFKVFDISNPSNPIIIADIIPENGYPGSIRDITVAGDFAYLAFYKYDELLGQPYEEFASYRIIDIENPANPAYIGEIEVSDIPYGVAVSEDYSYLTMENSGIATIDIHNPTKPIFLNTIDTSGTARDLIISGDHVYVEYVADDGAGI